MGTTMSDIEKAAERLLEELDCKDEHGMSGPAPASPHDDFDSEDEAGEFSPPPKVIPARQTASSETSASSTPHGLLRVLPRLLGMADTYRKSGALHQAIEMYFEIIREHPDTHQARLAEDRLLDVARTHEQAGELRQARGIYEQLL